MKIAFVKVGKSIKFNGLGYTATGGDNEPECCLKALANNNPDDTFYIIGRSNFKKLSISDRRNLFPHNNVVDIWDSYDSKNPVYLHVIDYLRDNNIKIDFSVLMIGQIGNISIPGKIRKVKDTSPGFASVIDMTLNYTSPIYYWINETDIPYMEVLTDPRYTSNQARDLLRNPDYSLGQYNYEYDRSHINNYNEQLKVTSKINSTYNGIETLFCVDRKIPNKSLNETKQNQFVIVLNEGDPSRYNLLDEWVLQFNNNVAIYGAWDNPKTKNDSRFKGSRQIEEIQNIMSNVRYTFIIPIKHGWVTSKYIEMIHAGVIPFFHPSYDTQNSLNVPDFIRPTTPIDLFKKIEFLEQNHEFRVSLINSLQDTYCKPEYYNGKFINNVIMTKIYNYFGDEYKEHEDIEVTKQDLSSFF